jgi:two-component system nitrogen regulation response regulator GlnG
MTTAKGLSSSIERHLRDYFAAHENHLPSAGLYGRILQEVERPLLSLALSECDGNQLRTAELLGLNRNTLRKKLRDLGLEAGRMRKNRSRAAND